MVEPEYDCEDVARANGAPTCWSCKRALVELKQMPEGWTWSGAIENTCEGCYKDVYEDADDPTFSDLEDAEPEPTFKTPPANAGGFWKRIWRLIL